MIYLDSSSPKHWLLFPLFSIKFVAHLERWNRTISAHELHDLDDSSPHPGDNDPACLRIAEGLRGLGYARSATSGRDTRTTIASSGVFAKVSVIVIVIASPA